MNVATFDMIFLWGFIIATISSYQVRTSVSDPIC